MSNHTERNQGSAPVQKTIFDYATEGLTFDALPEEAKPGVRQADKDKDARDALAEIRADQLFATAAGVLMSLMTSEEEKIQLGAACEVFRFRAVTMKSNKKRKTAEEVLKAVSDGFTFRR